MRSILPRNGETNITITGNDSLLDITSDPELNPDTNPDLALFLSVALGWIQFRSHYHCERGQTELKGETGAVERS